MSDKARISSLLRLGVSVPTLLLCSGLALAAHSDEWYDQQNTFAVIDEQKSPAPSGTAVAKPSVVLKKHAIQSVAAPQKTAQAISLPKQLKPSAAPDEDVPEPDLVVSFTPMQQPARTASNDLPSHGPVHIHIPAIKPVRPVIQPLAHYEPASPGTFSVAHQPPSPSPLPWQARPPSAI